MKADRTDSRDERSRIDAASETVRNMHDVYSNRRRRAILYYLQDRGGPVAVTALVRWLVAWRRGTAVGSEGEIAAGSEGETGLLERRRSWILQAHVLEMEELGILGYDPDTDTVWIPDDVAVSVGPP